MGVNIQILNTLFSESKLFALKRADPGYRIAGFVMVTIFYLSTRWYIFLGFNGTDDLHYAMLSSHLLNHTFNAFVPNDIFCGRILLLGFQSMIYRVAGISVLTTQMGTLLATVISCYLTLFRILKPVSWLQIIFSGFLFYFNPVLLGATLGIMPDPYIMLLGIYFILLTKKLISDETGKGALFRSFWLGAIIGASLLIKEIAILFLFFGIASLLIYKPRQAFVKIVMISLGFLCVVTAVGFYYYINTGNFFFKVVQINNSDYLNTINKRFVLKNLLTRLTFGPLQQLTVQGFYPVVLAIAISARQMWKKGSFDLKSNFYILSFFILLLLGLFFPFSLREFRLLRVEARHFLFLLPLAVVICSEYIFYQVKIGKTVFIFLLFLCLFAVCFGSTGNKWQWMIYGLFTALFFIGAYLKRHFQCIIYLFCSILWVSILENAFFGNYPWFKEMQILNKSVNAKRFYFIDHDNMMHWELLRQFDETHYSYYSLQKKPFLMFGPYYLNKDSVSFKPGWLVVNKVYPKPSSRFQNAFDSLRGLDKSGKSVICRNIEAFYIADSVTLRHFEENVN